MTNFKFLFILLLIFPNLSFSAYNRKEDLLKDLKLAGFNQVIEIPNSSLSGIKIYTDSGEEGLVLGEYVRRYGAQRIESLDVKGHSLVPSNYDAYVIANAFICYDYNNLSRKILGSQFKYCIMIPVPIDEVITALERKEQTSTRESNSTEAEQ